MNPENEVLKEAYRLLGTPYLWGGKGPDAFDCSGFVCHCLRMAIPSITDMCAARLYDWSFNKDLPVKEMLGALVFFSHPDESPMIDHVGICIGNGYYIESAGGDHTTTSVAVAENQGACVRIRPISSRKHCNGFTWPRFEITSNH